VACPCTITCDPLSVSAFRKMGFICTDRRPAQQSLARPARNLFPIVDGRRCFGHVLRLERRIRETRDASRRGHSPAPAWIRPHIRPGARIMIARVGMAELVFFWQPLVTRPAMIPSKLSAAAAGTGGGRGLKPAKRFGPRVRGQPLL